MNKRVHISTKRRAALFSVKQGRCHICSGQVKGAEAWDVSHVIPLEIGGADDESNWDVAHRKCHRDHTAKKDIPIIAKAKRREAKHRGHKAPAKAKISQRPKYEEPPKPGKIDKSKLPGLTEAEALQVKSDLLHFNNMMDVLFPMFARQLWLLAHEGSDR
jgi:5-methylcytosine-specific restriction protein A